jgi:hypothetical protein
MAKGYAAMFRVILDDGCRPIYVVETTTDAVWALRVAAEMRIVHTALSFCCGCVVYVQTNEGVKSGEWQNAVCVGNNDALIYAEGV